MKNSEFNIFSVVFIFLWITTYGNASAQKGEGLDSSLLITLKIDSAGISKTKLDERPKLHKFLISFGATVPFHKSMLWQNTFECDVRIYKNLFVGLTLETETQRYWDFKEYTDTLYGISTELNIKAFSNPFFSKEKIFRWILGRYWNR